MTIKTVLINGRPSDATILYQAILEKKPKTVPVNKHNKKYIDRWVSTHYLTLWQKFERYGEKITRRGYTKTDILHESLLRLYISKENYKDQADADRKLNKYFHIWNDETTDTTENNI